MSRIVLMGKVIEGGHRIGSITQDPENKFRFTQKHVSERGTDVETFEIFADLIRYTKDMPHGTYSDAFQFSALFDFNGRLSIVEKVQGNSILVESYQDAIKAFVQIPQVKELLQERSTETKRAARKERIEKRIKLAMVHSNFDRAMRIGRKNGFSADAMLWLTDPVADVLKVTEVLQRDGEPLPALAALEEFRKTLLAQREEEK